MSLFANVRRDFYANLVFSLYALGILLLDLVELDSVVNNHSYVLLGLIHLGSAWMYRFALVGRAWADPVVYPEIMNITSAALYLISAGFYNFIEQGAGALVTYIEVVAAVLDLLSCLGWAIIWRLTIPRFATSQLLAHGFDGWALLTSLAGAGIYVFYYFLKIIWQACEGLQSMYILADFFYVFAGFLCLSASIQPQGDTKPFAENGMASCLS